MQTKQNSGQVRLRRNSGGQVLIEAFVSISIATIGLIGVLSLMTSAVSANRNVAERFTATYLAGEGIEVVKSVISANYAEGRAWNTGLSEGSYELTYDTTGADLGAARIGSDPTIESNRVLRHNETSGLYSYDSSGAETTYTRTVQLTAVNADELKVVSLVSWIGRGGSEGRVFVEDHFFDWRPR